MAIDFHDPGNRGTYAGREASADWRDAVAGIVDPAGLRVADIGCGGGIYAAAWASLGAAAVVGVDFSAAMVEAAAEANRGRPNLAFRQGEAARTGLPAASADIVFARALIHHLADRAACFREAWRVLAPGGLCLVQDRTPADIALPGSPEHLRGYFFEVFPRLAAVEQGRRPDGATVERELAAAGFTGIRATTLWETRRRHDSAAALAADLRGRTGRSILHELSDPELDALIRHILDRLPADAPIVERDRWTLWWGRK
ncbi:class I SAM-dependent methyltransferase [Roseomonas sp. NAR14]|uniref:Class I SAM-dependent methyltransferase n=1 Tax=Roseomonas acroporae TaxID=2937791 RepID=A0A9X1Y8X5_9PROT|nr:class I SAM-dependent methyltransferase [Roseomonas acroporae]MCK8785646.1 class I SAM-dependent methyltransferase [Roseomonas acroporae]